MDLYDQQMSHNCTDQPDEQPSRVHHLPSNLVFPAAPNSGLRLPSCPPRPPPAGGDASGDGGGDDDDDELVADATPKKERDLVDPRALQNAKIEPVPNNGRTL